MDELILGELLDSAPDQDARISDVRSLAKSAEPTGRRRRSVPNVFTTLHGRPQPRQGFLSVEMLRAIYLRSEVVRACVDTMVELVCGVEWTIRPTDEDRAKWLKSRKPELYLDQQRRINWLKNFFRKPNNYESLGDFHSKLLRDLLIYDAGAYEIVAADVGDRYRLPVELGVIAAETMEIQADEAGIPRRYWQSYNVVRQEAFEPDEIAYFMQYPSSWQPYGLSVIETAITSIMSDLNANQYNTDYFQKNGIPPGLLGVLGVSNTEFKRIMAQLRGVSRDNPHNIHAFRAQRTPEGQAQKLFEYQPLQQQSNRDLQFKELITLTINRICMLYRTTPSQIGFTEQVAGGIGSGVAETQENLMQNKGVAPLLRKLSEVHTSRVIHGCCQWSDLEFSFTQAHTPQEDADYQRDQGEVNNGSMTINEFRSKWGGRSPVEWGDDPLVVPQGYQMKQQQQQQMGMMGGGMPGMDGGGGAPQLPAAGPDDGGGDQDMQKSAQPRRIIIRL